jgi:hypothetical protein
VHKETSLSQSNRVTSLKKNLHDESEHWITVKYLNSTRFSQDGY